MKFLPELRRGSAPCCTPHLSDTHDLAVVLPNAITDHMAAPFLKEVNLLSPDG